MMHDDALTLCLKDMLGKPPIYVVVCALDKCPDFFGLPLQERALARCTFSMESEE